MGRFRASSLGSGAIILAVLLLILHRNGTGLLFLVVGGGLLWYGRNQRKAQESATQEREGPHAGAEGEVVAGGSVADGSDADGSEEDTDARRPHDGEA